MINKLIKYSAFLILCTFLVACSSVSSKTALDISSKQEAIAGDGCVRAKNTGNTFDQVRWARGILSPAVTIASGALAPVVIGVNAALDYADRSNASQMKEACHLPPTRKEEMLTDVALSSGVSVAIGAIDLGLGTDVSKVQQSFSTYSSD